ncbi:MAG: ClpXP protease specificity-enhancing factor [Deltaproteobacteria bacterium]|nr:ClpXP protease specificity-enhancing factor [Deltaproteobacteria bacterium]
MTVSTKPYLVRAIWEWCADQGFTPYLAVAVDSRTRVPREFVRDGQIVLNVGNDACHQLVMGNEDISFQARFSGKVFSVLVPLDRVAAIYAKENGQGMAFEVFAEGQTVSSDEEAGALELQGEDGENEGETIEEVTDVADIVEDTPRTPPAGRPFLTRIK